MLSFVWWTISIRFSYFNAHIIYKFYVVVGLEKLVLVPGIHYCGNDQFSLRSSTLAYHCFSKYNVSNFIVWMSQSSWCLLSNFSSALNKGINTDADAASVDNDIDFVISSTGLSAAIVFLTTYGWWIVNMLMESYSVAYSANPPIVDPDVPWWLYRCAYNTLSAISWWLLQKEFLLPSAHESLKKMSDKNRIHHVVHPAQHMCDCYRSINLWYCSSLQG